MASFRKRNNKWQVRIQRQDYPPIAKSFIELKTAKQWAAHVEREMDKGIFVPNRSEQLGKCLIRYQQEILPTKKNSQPDWYRINRLCQQPIANKNIKVIRSHDVANLRDELIKDNKSANTIRLYLAILSHLFTIARTEWGFDNLNNPVLKIRRPRLPQSRHTRLSDDDIHRICQHSKSRLLPLLIHIALDTAMRVSEIVNLKVIDCDFKQHMITVRNTKNYHDRYIPMTKKVTKILQHQTRLQGDKLFNMTSHGVSVGFYRACKRAEISNASFHTLRHEAVSRLFEKGLNPMEVATISGHQSMQMLKRYTHYQFKFIKDKLAKKT
jgi:integrase